MRVSVGKFPGRWSWLVKEEVRSVEEGATLVPVLSRANYTVVYFIDGKGVERLHGSYAMVLMSTTPRPQNHGRISGTENTGLG